MENRHGGVRRSQVGVMVDLLELETRPHTQVQGGMYTSLEKWLVPMTVLVAVSAEFVKTPAFPALLK